MSARTLQPRDLDPRTLRVVRRMLAELSASLLREARVWEDRRPVVDDDDELDYASGLRSAVHDIDMVARDLAATEKVMRARMKRRKR